MKLTYRHATEDDLPVILNLLGYFGAGNSELSLEEALVVFRHNMVKDQYIYVAEYRGRIVATANVSIVHKLIHCGGKVGKIEELVVDDKMQGRGVGSQFLTFLVEQIRLQGCYKACLDCLNELVPFYRHNGFCKRYEENVLPNYHYRCENSFCRNEFQTYQSIKDAPLLQCPECQYFTLQRVFYAVDINTNSEPKTVGGLADRNARKMGRFQREDKEHQLKTMNRGWHGHTPEGAENIPSETRPQSSADMSLNRLTLEQRHRYIMEGKKPPGL